MTKVGVIIPDRGDRRAFLFNCWRMIKRQTLQPHRIELVNDKPLTDKVDITWRYRTGYDRFRSVSDASMNVDVIALMENDDWYSPDYLETVVKAWEKAGRPDLFGQTYTIYYHIGLRAFHTMKHPDRSSAMNTLIRPDLKFTWPVDEEPFTDMWLWTRSEIKKKSNFDPGRHICLGIKHGVGKCGGESHTTRLHRYQPPRGTIDTNGKFLQETIDTESFKFYAKYYESGGTFPFIADNTDFLPSQIQL